MTTSRVAASQFGMRLEHVVVGIAADHLRASCPLRWRGSHVRPGWLAVGAQVRQMIRVRVMSGIVQSSRRSTAASSPITPTIVISPGAMIGGPIGTL